MLKIKEIYPYSFGDRITNDRNTYFYTKYHGRDTFCAWQQARLMISSEIDSVNDLNALFDTKNNTDAAEFIHILSLGNRIITDKLLDSVYIAIDDPSLQNEAIFWLKKLTKKFEVCKRIHKDYQSQRFLAVEKQQHSDIWLYIKLAALLSKGYGCYKELPFLNVYIKILDSICSQQEKLDKKMKRYIAELVQKERVFIEEIADLMKVSIYE